MMENSCEFCTVRHCTVKSARFELNEESVFERDQCLTELPVRKKLSESFRASLALCVFALRLRTPKGVLLSI